MFSKFDEEVRKLLLGAKKEMNLLKHSYIGTEHLMLSILKKNNFVTNKFKQYNVTYNTFRESVLDIVGMGEVDSQWFIYTPLLKKVIENSIILSKEKGSKEVNLNILFLALLEEGEGIAIRILISLGIDVDKLYDEINLLKENKKQKNKLLIDDLGINLNKRAIGLEIDPVIGREKEVQKVIEILCRRTKNNPLLIGEAGVGKTAIVEELSRRIVEGSVPTKIINKRIVSISMANLVSGTKYRGEFEERVTKLLKEVEDENDVIIFIDEIHTLVGAGGAEGAIDASNILKPALARGKVNIIGATTTIEYKKFIEDDKALARRFQNVIVEEPNTEKVYDILFKLKPIYEEYHNVTISNEILKLIIKLSDKYLYSRKQPDKSIDILDEVCSKVSVSDDKLSSRNIYYKNLLKTIKNLKNEAIVNNKFNEAIYLKEEEAKLESCINKLEIKLINKMEKKIVTREIVAEVIKDKSSIPVHEIVPSNIVINELNDILSSKIIGQDDAIKFVCNNTRKFLSGIKYDGKPLSFMFVGSTGVGKTLLAKEYGKMMFGENNVVRVDMSEYKEEHSISKIIGSPPGYVGYQNKVSLLEDIKDKPYSLLLLDEIEKAHPSVLNLFLQILDEGKIKDSSGNIFRFDNVVIIMTSNAGCIDSGIGFDNDRKSNIFANLKRVFNIEFINRIDKLLIFNRLSYEDIKKIVVKKIEYIINKLDIAYEYEDSLIDSIIKESEYELFGARKIEKIIMEKLDEYLFSDDNSKIGVN